MNKDAIIVKALGKMLTTTCAEASFEALQEVFDLNSGELDWIPCGYMGAIASGQTTCGLLNSATAALGLACGKGKSGRPEENEAARDKAIALVNELYRNFIEKFQTTQCKTLLQFDFSTRGPSQFMEAKIYEGKCDVFLNFVINYCMDIVQKNKL
ncbi:MAG: C-GCAxxG-C-C family protein [Thermodesulfobacteriota bacterium]